MNTGSRKPVSQGRLGFTALTDDRPVRVSHGWARALPGQHLHANALWRISQIRRLVYLQDIADGFLPSAVESMTDELLQSRTATLLPLAKATQTEAYRKRNGHLRKAA